jgi:hypothetical protein
MTKSKIELRPINLEISLDVVRARYVALNLGILDKTVEDTISILITNGATTLNDWHIAKKFIDLGYSVTRTVTGYCITLEKQYPILNKYQQAEFDLCKETILQQGETGVRDDVIIGEFERLGYNLTALCLPGTDVPYMTVVSVK